MDKRSLYGAVSVMALLVAAGTAKAQTVTGLWSDFAGGNGPVAIDTENALENFSFQNVTGALQVQQNASLNSMVGQNLAIDTLKTNNGPSAFYSTASSTNTVEENYVLGNAKPDASINSHAASGDNHVADSAFANAAGAVQVQQNRSINSSTGQNVDIDPITASSFSGGSATAKLTNNVGDLVGNSVTAGHVAGNNVIDGSAFLDAAGVFQAQQNNSINSSTQQNAAITAETGPNGGFPVGVSSEADLTQDVSDNLALWGDVSGLNTISGNAFQNAKGAFQVQQSSSINSGVGQNMAITHVTTGPGGSAQIANAANATSTVDNNAVGWEIIPPGTYNLTRGSTFINPSNLLDGLTFSSAAGAFQAQQNGSVGSAVGQNMAIAATKLADADTAKTEAATATSTNEIDNNVVIGSGVLAGGNTIQAQAFENSAGAFQVQQNRSFNSSTGQNMQIDAMTDPGGSLKSQVNSTAGLESRVGVNKQNDALESSVFGFNTATDQAFHHASGAFQVQQNSSANSSTQQNMSITALRVPGGSVSSLGMGGEADLTGSARLSRAVLAGAGGLNRVDSSAFENANGAFQVQQSTSADSAVGQNIAIASVDTMEGPAGGSLTPTGTAKLISSVSIVTSGINHFSPIGTPPGGYWYFYGLTSAPVNVALQNRIDGFAFGNAHGAFEVQQNGSINGVVSQNLAITAATLDAAPTGNVPVDAENHSSVFFNRADSSNIVATGGDDVVDGLAFQNASGAFQVQQNRSIDSATGQNMAIAAVNDAGALTFGPNDSTAHATQAVFGNATTNSNVAGTNAISNAFSGAAGAFQVQQNNSVSSSTQQNMAIGAVDTAGAPSFAASAEVANLGATISGNSLSNVTLAGLNNISGVAFTGARGAFQVQQSTSANSAVTQNMSIVAISVK